MTISATQMRILNDLIGKGSSKVTGCDFCASPIYIGSTRELTAVRALEDAGLGRIWMANGHHAYPQYYFVAEKDSEKAFEIWREMYVTKECDEVKYA